MYGPCIYIYIIHRSTLFPAFCGIFDVPIGSWNPCYRWVELYSRLLIHELSSSDGCPACRLMILVTVKSCEDEFQKSGNAKILPLSVLNLGNSGWESLYPTRFLKNPFGKSRCFLESWKLIDLHQDVSPPKKWPLRWDDLGQRNMMNVYPSRAWLNDSDKHDKPVWFTFTFEPIQMQSCKIICNLPCNMSPRHLHAIYLLIYHEFTAIVWKKNSFFLSPRCSMYEIFTYMLSQI